MTIPREVEASHWHTVFAEVDASARSADFQNANLPPPVPFCTDPSEYKWRILSEKVSPIPFISAASPPVTGCGNDMSQIDSVECVEQQVCVVEGTLHPGESNRLARRVCYFHSKNQSVLFGEGFDSRGEIVQLYMLPDRTLIDKVRWGSWYSTIIPKNL
jgi:hypothetical protein